MVPLHYFAFCPRKLGELTRELALVVFQLNLRDGFAHAVAVGREWCKVELCSRCTFSEADDVEFFACRKTEALSEFSILLEDVLPQSTCCMLVLAANKHCLSCSIERGFRDTSAPFSRCKVTTGFASRQQMHHTF